MGKMSYNNLLPPGLKPTADQSNKGKQRIRQSGGRPTKYGFKRPTISR